MICPKCNAENYSRVLETRSTPEYIRRRRECQKCGQRFFTKEYVAGNVRRYSTGKKEKGEQTHDV